MSTENLIKKALPERTLGRAGYDLFSTRKDLTVIMVPFERFSPFANAVDDLYKTIDVPFNLIIVEGNAPESVRESLEKRQRKYKNITIIYSNHQTSIGAAINLAMPHVRTKYAFVIDNDVRIPRGAVSTLLASAIKNQYGIVWPQNYVAFSRWENKENKRDIQNLGMRTCFLVSRETIQKIGRFDENMTPFTTGIDIRMAAEEMGISIYNETDTCLELDTENLLWPMDASLHSFQWDVTRVSDSLKGLEKKWGIHLRMQDYAVWLSSKKCDLLAARNPFLFLGSILSKIKFMHRKNEKSSQKYFREFLLPQAA